MNVWLNRFRTYDWRNMWPKVVAAVPVIIFLLIPVFTQGEIVLNMLILSGIWAVAAMGFTLILRTGQFSLGQAAFMAIGGYTCAILTVVLGWPWWWGFLLSGIVSGLIAMLIGSVVLRVGGIYFSIITLSLTEVIRIIAQQWESVTHGSRGLITTPPPNIDLGPLHINFMANSVPFYYLTLILVAVTGLVFWQIGKTRMGGTFYAMLANQTLAEHEGIHLMRYRVIAFTLAGVFAGFAGAIYANYLTVISPLIFGLWQSIQIMMMSIVGGMSSLVAGPIIGSTVLYILGIQLSRLPIYGISQLLYGAVVVLVLIFLPKGTGLIDLCPRIWRKIYREVEDYEIPGETRQED
jgi:branched-chain amino acid transport system permease protein